MTLKKFHFITLALLLVIASDVFAGGSVEEPEFAEPVMENGFQIVHSTLASRKYHAITVVDASGFS